MKNLEKKITKKKLFDKEKREIIFGILFSLLQLDNHEIKPGKTLKINISVPNLRLFVGNIPKSKGKEEILEEFGKLTGNVETNFRNKFILTTAVFFVVVVICCSILHVLTVYYCCLMATCFFFVSCEIVCGGRLPHIFTARW